MERKILQNASKQNQIQRFQKKMQEKGKTGGFLKCCKLMQRWNIVYKMVVNNEIGGFRKSSTMSVKLVILKNASKWYKNCRFTKKTDEERQI